MSNFVFVNSHLLEEATLSHTACTYWRAEGCEDGWEQSTGPAGTKEGWWLPSCANKLQSGITTFLNMARSLRRAFYRTFSLPSKSTPIETVPYKTVHFPVHVKICYSSINACSTQEMRLYFAFYFSRLYFF